MTKWFEDKRCFGHLKRGSHEALWNMAEAPKIILYLWWMRKGLRLTCMWPQSHPSSPLAPLCCCSRGQSHPPQAGDSHKMFFLDNNKKMGVALLLLYFTRKPSLREQKIARYFTMQRWNPYIMFKFTRLYLYLIDYYYKEIMTTYRTCYDSALERC
jgi:hypothetical protein